MLLRHHNPVYGDRSSGCQLQMTLDARSGLVLEHRQGGAGAAHTNRYLPVQDFKNGRRRGINERHFEKDRNVNLSGSACAIPERM